MESKNSWTKKLKEKIKDYSCETPEGGWNALEKELMLNGAHKPKHINLRRTVGIATAALIVVTSICACLICSPGDNAEKIPAPISVQKEDGQSMDILETDSLGEDDLSAGTDADGGRLSGAGRTICDM
jgi:hypothetical protein